MKLIVWMLTVLMISSSIVAQESEEPDISPKEFLAEVNVMRREFAKMRNISNMHEMSWDENLVREVIKYVEKDSNRNDGTYARCWAESYKKQLNDMKNETPRLVASLNGEDTTIYARGADSFFFCPLHKNLGCKLFKTNGNLLHCFMSPRQSVWTEDTFNVTGTPGSKCNGCYANNDGLCSLIGSFTTAASSSGTIIPILQLSIVLVLHFLYHF